MKSVGAVAVVMVGSLLVAAGSAWVESEILEVSAPDTYGAPAAGVTGVSYDELSGEAQRREFIVDRYGNHIEKAVGDYRVDPGGDIFERHSPATAVAELPDPSA